MSFKLRHGMHGRSHTPGIGSDPIDLSGVVARIVRGAVDDDANILAGTGFTAEFADEDGSDAGTYFYTIRFDEPFTNPPIVALTPNNDNAANLDGRYTATLDKRNVAYIVVITQDVDDADAPAQDGGFDFLAVEPAV